MCSNESTDRTFPTELDPESWAWLPGVDYVTGWKAAREIAERLNAALAGVGLPAEQMRATAGNLADGRGVVRIKGTPYAARWLAVLLESIVTEQQRTDGAA